MKRHPFPQILCLINKHLSRIKPQHILIPNPVRNAVTVQLIPENVRCGKGLLPVFGKNRRTGKTKEKRLREGLFDDG